MGKIKNNPTLNTRRGLLITGGVSLVIVWLLFLRATDTGSLQQYGLLIVFLIFAINRFIKALQAGK